MNKKNMRRPAAVGFLIAGLVLAGCSQQDDGANEPAEQPSSAESSPAPGEAESQSVFDLSKGDCMVMGDVKAGDIQDLDRIDCEEKHDAEIYAEKDMTEANYPGVDATVKQTENFCAEEFEPFVGVPGGESKLKVNYLHPTQDSWDQEDDRKIQCVVVDPAGDVTGSLEGSKK